MSCPIPSDFQDLIIDQNASVCEALGKLGPASQLWYDAYSCIYKNNLDFTEEFRNKICATGCGGSGGGSTSTSTTQAGSGQQDYSAAGNYEFTVPAGITSLTVIAVGGGGGGGGRGSPYGFPYTTGQSGGGSGEKRVHTFTVVPGEIVYVSVGSGGVQDGVTGNGSSGGATAVSYSATLIVANGGGGGSTSPCSSAPFTGGSGGSGGSGGTGTSGVAGGSVTTCPGTGSGGASVGLSAGAGSSGSSADNTHPGSAGAVRITW